jgi:hypothetical protein
MPQIGHDPGSFEITSGCIPQVYSTVSLSETAASTERLPADQKWATANPISKHIMATIDIFMALPF